MNYKILVVENNLILSDLLKTILQSNGYSVKTSLSPSLAKDLAEIWKPNLIILDSNISDIKASRLIHEIRGSFAIPALLIGSLDSHLSESDCLAAGAIDWIFKPVSIPELMAKVNAIKKGMVLPINQYRDINTFHGQIITYE